MDHPAENRIQRNTDHLALSPSTVLNLDVLSLVLSMVEEREDLLAAMQTCHALYAAGIRPLVRLPIFLSDCSLRSYRDFMIAHAPISFMAFRSLILIPSTGKSISSANFPLVVELLKRGANLRELWLSSKIVAADGAPQAISALKKLETLVIAGEAFGAIHSILSNLRSPLTDFHAHFGDVKEDPIPLLANFQHTLAWTRLTNVKFASTEICYPKLTTLELFLCDELPLSILTAVFPNLEKLVVNAGDVLRSGPAQIQQLDQLRAENIAFQEGRKSWESLSSVTSDLASLHAMGLKHKLSSLDITDILDSSDDIQDRLSRLHDILSTTTTKDLTVALPDRPEFLSKAFVGLKGRLTQLEVGVHLRHSSGHEQVLDALFEGLNGVSAYTIGLKIGVNDTRSGDPTEDPHPAKRYIDQLDSNTLADRVGDSSPAVGIVYTDIDGRDRSVWMNMGYITGEGGPWREVRREETTNGTLLTLLGQIGYLP